MNLCNNKMNMRKFASIFISCNILSMFVVFGQQATQFISTQENQIHIRDGIFQLKGQYFRLGEVIPIVQNTKNEFINVGLWDELDVVIDIEFQAHKNQSFAVIKSTSAYCKSFGSGGDYHVDKSQHLKFLSLAHPVKDEIQKFRYQEEYVYYGGGPQCDNGADIYKVFELKRINNGDPYFFEHPVVLHNDKYYAKDSLQTSDYNLNITNNQGFNSYSIEAEDEDIDMLYIRSSVNWEEWETKIVNNPYSQTTKENHLFFLPQALTEIPLNNLDPEFYWLDLSNFWSDSPIPFESLGAQAGETIQIALTIDGQILYRDNITLREYEDKLIYLEEFAKIPVGNEWIGDYYLFYWVDRKAEPFATSNTVLKVGPINHSLSSSLPPKTLNNFGDSWKLIPGIGSIESIQSDSLAEAIRRNLDKKRPHLSELKNLKYKLIEDYNYSYFFVDKTIDTRPKPIDSLNGLEQATNLESITIESYLVGISSTLIESLKGEHFSLEPISNLPVLNELNISDSDISSFDFSGRWPSLEKLNLRGHNFKNLDLADSMSQLSSLTIDNTSYDEFKTETELSLPSKMDSLKELNIHIQTDVIPLPQSLKSLETLNISQSVITGAKELKIPENTPTHVRLLVPHDLEILHLPNIFETDDSFDPSDLNPSLKIRYY